MSIIKHNLLPAQKSRKYILDAEIDLYPYATELYNELENIGIIDRIKSIHQLGVIKVPKKFQKTRYDYVMLQLYLHQLIKSKLKGQLKYTYNNPVRASEFSDSLSYPPEITDPSIGDILQLLTIVYNIGHFYNTFTASRAVSMMAAQDDSFFNMVVSSSERERFGTIAKKLLSEKNYQRLHLLNSLLILEKCDQGKASIAISTEILYAYLCEECLPVKSKLHYAFSIFRNVRTVAYMAYDLQIANTPLQIDLSNDDALMTLMRELLSDYNDNLPSHRLVESMSKLLDDNIYNENANAICYYIISRRIVTLLERDNDFRDKSYYDNYFLDASSALNTAHSHHRDYVGEQILKLTFPKSARSVSERLLLDLERINNTRVGYYDRNTGAQTILVSIKQHCDPSAKAYAALKVLRQAVSAVRKVEGVTNDDVRFLLCVKFFLFYLFGERPLLIQPTVSEKICVICTRGKNSRIAELNKLMKNSNGNDDENHEVQFLLSRLLPDKTNDTSITLPGSIIVYEKGSIGRKLFEFDGMIIHPMRSKEQIVFLEAKNTTYKPQYGKKCLYKKLKTLNLCNDSSMIKVIDHDASMSYSIHPNL